MGRCQLGGIKGRAGNLFHQAEDSWRSGNEAGRAAPLDLQERDAGSARNISGNGPIGNARGEARMLIGHVLDINK